MNGRVAHAGGPAFARDRTILQRYNRGRDMSTTRRRAVQALTAASAGPFFAFAKNSQANLLFLCSDQHRTAAAGCYGSTQVHTPHIDEIAADGVRFNHAYCQAPVCVPSRGSIITGLYPHRHGAKILQDALAPDIPTVGHFFKERGYTTGAIGKMHFVDESRKHGFDHRLHNVDHLARLTAQERQALKRDQGGAGDVDGRPSGLTERYFSDTFFAEESVAFLRANKDRRFCLWSSFYMPHTPLVPQKRFWDLYESADLTLPERRAHELEDDFEGHLIRAKERGWYQQTDEELRRGLNGYYGNVSQMDSNLGRVFDTLRELGLDKNTVVVYTSDHGEMAGAHRMWTKHNMFEQSVNVPLIVRMPDRMEGGKAREQLIEQVDLFPTLAELCGFEPPGKIDGRSFAPLVQGRDFQSRDFAYSEYYFCRNVFTKDDRYVGREPILMARTPDWKLNYLSWDRCELFDLRKDPGEFHNVIDDAANAAIVRELTAAVRNRYES